MFTGLLLRSAVSSFYGWEAGAAPASGDDRALWERRLCHWFIGTFRGSTFESGLEHRGIGYGAGMDKCEADPKQIRSRSEADCSEAVMVPSITPLLQLWRRESPKSKSVGIA